MKNKKKEDEDKLLDDLDKIEDEDKKKEDEVVDPKPDDDDVIPAPEPDPEEKNIVDMMVSGDDDGVKSAIHKHVVAVVAKTVNDIGEEPVVDKEDEASDE